MKRQTNPHIIVKMRPKDQNKRDHKYFQYIRQSLHGNVEAKLYVGDSKSMSEIEDNFITLTVTSPPYWNAIDYDTFAQDPKSNFRTRKYGTGFSKNDYESYLLWLCEIFDEVLRVTRPGGYLAIVIGTVLLKGKLYPIPFDLTSLLSRRGWEFHQDIIWHKVTAGVKRAGLFIQRPYPGYYRPNIMNEYILIFRKPGEPIYRTIEPNQMKTATVPIDELFVQEIANNVWHIAPVPPGVIKHPAPFPEEIPSRLIQLYAYPGDWVLDPFLGSGQTVKAALHLGRNAIGYDLIPSYVEYAYHRLNEPPGLRSHQLVARFVKIPFGAIRGYLRRQRSNRTRHGSGPRKSKTAHA
ncbi:MAG: site-specific DNA-methyltransferase [Candidatus Hydrothermae bacterium]|nr:site-specific DNA-methyltransferase [Candidatus Hydrothermae bacterium]